METYSIFDAVFLIALILSAIFGYIKGLVRQLIGLAGIIVGTYFAYRFAFVSTDWWHQHFNVDEKAMRIIVFVIFAIIIYFIAFWLAKMVDKILKMAMLNWINRLLGLLFGAIKTVIIFSALTYAIYSLKLTGIEVLNSDLKKSKTYTSLVDVANTVFPYIKEFKIRDYP